MKKKCRQHFCGICCGPKYHGFDYLPLFPRHKYYTEENRLLFFCDLCDEGFERQTDLMDHYKTGHDGEEEFECIYCGKVFKPPFKIKFAKHMQVSYCIRQNCPSLSVIQCYCSCGTVS